MGHFIIKLYKSIGGGNLHTHTSFSISGVYFLFGGCSQNFIIDIKKKTLRFYVNKKKNDVIPSMNIVKILAQHSQNNSRKLKVFVSLRFHNLF